MDLEPSLANSSAATFLSISECPGTQTTVTQFDEPKLLIIVLHVLTVRESVSGEKKYQKSGVSVESSSSTLWKAINHPLIISNKLGKLINTYREETWKHRNLEEAAAHMNIVNSLNHHLNITNHKLAEERFLIRSTLLTSSFLRDLNSLRSKQHLLYFAVTGEAVLKSAAPIDEIFFIFSDFSGFLLLPFLFEVILYHKTNCLIGWPI